MGNIMVFPFYILFMVYKYLNTNTDKLSIYSFAATFQQADRFEIHGYM